MHSSRELDPTRREYGLNVSKKLTYLAYAVLLIGGAGFFFKLALDPVGRDFVLVVGAILLLLGLLVVSLAFRSRLSLCGNEIEVRSALRTFTADRTEIEGLRKMEDQYGRRTRIYLKQNRGAFNVSDSFTGDDDLNDWLKGLPDLDQRDAEQITQEIKNADSLVSTENEHWHPLKQAKAWAIGLSIFSGVVSVPVMFVSYAPVFKASLVSLGLCPLLGTFLVHRSPLLFTIFKRKSDPRADIGYFIFWPGLGMLLSYKTGNDPAHLVDASQLSYWILISLVCFVAAYFRIAWQHPSRWGVLAGLVLLGGMYCTGLVNAANTVPDRSHPILYRSKILGKHQTTGKNARSYLRLAPWGPMADSDDADVPSGIYRQVEVGDVICVSLHSGFLHAPWYSLTPCGEQMATPSPQVP